MNNIASGIHRAEAARCLNSLLRIPEGYCSDLGEKFVNCIIAAAVAEARATSFGSYEIEVLPCLLRSIAAERTDARSINALTHAADALEFMRAPKEPK